MIFLSIIGVAAILFVLLLVVLAIASVCCQPVDGDGVTGRMANRAAREMEQDFYKILSSMMLGVIMLIGYAFYCLFVR